MASLVKRGGVRLCTALARSESVIDLPAARLAHSQQPAGECEVAAARSTGDLNRARP